MGCGSSVNTQEPTNKKHVSERIPQTKREGSEQTARGSQEDRKPTNKSKERSKEEVKPVDQELDEIMGKNVPKMLVDVMEPSTREQVENVKEKTPVSVQIPLQRQPSLELRQKFETPKAQGQQNNDPTQVMMAGTSNGYLTSMKELGQDPVQRNQKKAPKKFRGNEPVYEDIFENVKREEKQLGEKEKQLIEKCFSAHFVFYSLSKNAQDELVKKMFYCVIEKDEFIFRQGDQASCYFIIDSGEVQIIIDNKLIRQLESGQSFGELALLYGAQRSASIKAVTKCSFWALDRKVFKSVLENLISQEQQENRKFIEEVSFFSFMTSQQKDSIAGTLITTRFAPGNQIVNQGDSADSYFVIKSGQVSIWKDNKEIRKMGPKDSFGEQALYVHSQRGASVKAETEVKCVSLGRDTITKILGDKVQIIIFNNIMRWAINQSEILSQLTKIQTEKVASSAKINNFKSETVIFNRGEVCDKLIIVLEGQLLDISTQKLYSKGECFGDHFMTAQNRKQQLKGAIKVASDGVMAIISFNQIYKLIGGDLETVLKKNIDSHEKKIAQLAARQDMSHIRVEDLIFIKKLGQGQFGSVYLVQHKKDKSLIYALKSVSKAMIIEQNLEKHVIQEKTVLEMAHFPFIMSFVRTFKDNLSVYFLVEYIKGMELFDVIREIGLLTISDTQFYIGTLILVLEYLHSKQIVYRDIKPENIMVDHLGYMYLIDMGTAKPLLRSKNFRTFTIIGTPHYMAPEIIANKGYTFYVDLWSVGVCAFEFLCGGVPYAEEAEDPYEIYEEIMSTELRFPSFMKDKLSRKIIEQLLSKQPEARLGASFASLKAHPWFDDFDWDKLFARTLQPPFIPPSKQLIQQREIDQIFAQGKPVVNEIKQEQQQQKLTYRKEKARDPDWDKDF